MLVKVVGADFVNKKVEVRNYTQVIVDLKVFIQSALVLVVAFCRIARNLKISGVVLNFTIEQIKAIDLIRVVNCQFLIDEQAHIISSCLYSCAEGLKLLSYVDVELKRFFLVEVCYVGADFVNASKGVVVILNRSKQAALQYKRKRL